LPGARERRFGDLTTTFSTTTSTTSAMTTMLVFEEKMHHQAKRPTRRSLSKIWDRDTSRLYSGPGAGKWAKDNEYEAHACRA